MCIYMYVNDIQAIVCAAKGICTMPIFAYLAVLLPVVSVMR